MTIGSTTHSTPSPANTQSTTKLPAEVTQMEYRQTRARLDPDTVAAVERSSGWRATSRGRRPSRLSVLLQLQLDMTPASRQAGSHQEEPGAGGGRVLPETGLQDGGAPEGERAQIVVLDPTVGEHQPLHLGRRDVLFETEGVLRFGELLGLVGLFQKARTIHVVELDLIGRRHGRARLDQLGHLLRLELALEQETLEAVAIKENGAVAALINRFPTTLRMAGQTLNFGSSIDPEIGRSMSMTPRRSLSSATARRTGALTASGLSTLSPKVN